VLEAASAAASLIQGAEARWSWPSGVPLFEYTIRIDPLSAFFNLALAILVAAVSVYSLGYVRGMEGRRNIGVLGCLYNVLLASLTLVFTASNVMFFLIAWEVMAVSAYLLVSFEHEDEETRRAGVLFLIMSRAGTGLLLIGFLILGVAAGSLDFAAFHLLGSKLPAASGAVVFLLFFLGFGVRRESSPFTSGCPRRIRSLRVIFLR
jgi:hydrogenase-4 component B